MEDENIIAILLLLSARNCMHMNVEEEEEKAIDNDNNMIADIFIIVEKSYIFLNWLYRRQSLSPLEKVRANKLFGVLCAWMRMRVPSAGLGGEKTTKNIYIRIVNNQLPWCGYLKTFTTW